MSVLSLHESLMRVENHKFLFWVLYILCSICVSLEYVPQDNFLINCGSTNGTLVGDRLFLPDNSTPNYTLSTPEDVLAKTNSNSVPSSFDSSLYQTARILKRVSHYRFPIKRHGRHWIRLYFFPFVFEKYNMSAAKFSISVQGVTLVKDFQLGSGPLKKEYSLNITSDTLEISFTPSSSSFAFINALEVISLPDELIPEVVISPEGHHHNIRKKGLETVFRVNMGNRSVSTQEDTLWRHWVSEDGHLKHSNLVSFVSDREAVHFNGTKVKEHIAPRIVYGTVSRLQSEDVYNFNANVTWSFDVDPGFDYLFRFHFCDIVNRTPLILLENVYVNTQLVGSLDSTNLTSNTFGAPYYMDSITRISGRHERNLNVSVGPSHPEAANPDAILNGLEIMKISNTDESFVLDSGRRTKIKVVIIPVVVAGALLVIAAFAMFLLLLHKRKNRGHDGLSEDHFSASGRRKFPNNTTIFPSSKIGYRFPFVAVQEATDNFSENLIIGIGGFGKVYKGVLKDETKVALKRGCPQSQQGLVEFNTEIEMLSQFRHRHLVSLIGYCDEQNERIIIYEFMEKGSLKNHLYGSEVPRLSWRQRLDICIGSAKGLHYLHTGSAKAIIHRDVKSANILLDENYMAKVADFGISKVCPEIDQTHVSTAVRGSFGYLDPEYLTTQQLTEKSDVYSFGVVMFEVLCGRPAIDPSLPRDKVNLVEWVMKCRQRGQLEEIVDPCLTGQVKAGSLHKFVEISEKCLAEHGTDRPAMGDVLWNLECALQLQSINERSNPIGEEPSQAFHYNSSETDMSSMQFSTGSINDLAGVSMSKVFAQMVREDMTMR